MITREIREVREMRDEIREIREIRLLPNADLASGLGPDFALPQHQDEKTPFATASTCCPREIRTP